MDDGAAAWIRDDDRSYLAAARRIVGNHPDAEDVLQDACLELLRQPVPAEVRDVRTWSLGIIRHCALHRVRGDARRARHEAAAAQATDVAPTPVPGDPDDVARQLVPSLHLLSADATHLVRAYLIDGRSIQDIARGLGRSPATVRTQLRRALARLRQDPDLRRRLASAVPALALIDLTGMRARWIPGAGRRPGWWFAAGLTLVGLIIVLATSWMRSPPSPATAPDRPGLVLYPETVARYRNGAGQAFALAGAPGALVRSRTLDELRQAYNGELVAGEPTAVSFLLRDGERNLSDTLVGPADGFAAYRYRFVHRTTWQTSGDPFSTSARMRSIGATGQIMEDVTAELVGLAQASLPRPPSVRPADIPARSMVYVFEVVRIGRLRDQPLWELHTQIWPNADAMAWGIPLRSQLNWLRGPLIGVCARITAHGPQAILLEAQTAERLIYPPAD
jgi:RNA polymerase sigma-70 factor, ECF subfamily